MTLLWQIFLSFAKLGTIAYGGGPAMLPIIQAEVVEGQEWTSDEDFSRAIAMGYMLPGPIAPKIAFWVGLQTSGIVGAFVALAGVLLPSLTMMYILTTFLWGNIDRSPVLEGAARGATIGVIGLLAYLVYNQARKVFITEANANWLGALAAHPEWVALVMVVFGLSLWKPNVMVPISLVGSAIFGAIFLR